jgi:hypothetical protein
MLAVLIAIPIFLILIVLQSAIVSATPLLHGYADIVLLTIIAWSLQERVKAIWQWAIIGGILAGLFSKAPFFLTLFAYLIVTVMIIYMRNKLRGMPYLAMWTVTFLGTIIYHGITLAARWFEIPDLHLYQALNLIVLPSLLLNMLLAAPFYAIIRDLANWLYPVEANV